ncbi:hypothetical protein MRX96_048453 [Rhipicephalus microplus]
MRRMEGGVTVACETTEMAAGLGRQGVLVVRAAISCHGPRVTTAPVKSGYLVNQASRPSVRANCYIKQTHASGCGGHWSVGQQQRSDPAGHASGQSGCKSNGGRDSITDLQIADHHGHAIARRK